MPPAAALNSIVRYADRLLKTESFEDWQGAVNGLQVENNGQITRIAAAVDGVAATIRMAIAARADLLLVHHGLFWSASHPWTGKQHELMRLLFENNLAVYSSHLPLDAHRRFGNNALLAAALGFRSLQPFFAHKGRSIGWKTTAQIPRDRLTEKLTRVLGRPPLLIPGGGKVCRRIGIVTGGAGAELKQAAEEGVDTFITGEGPHWTYGVAESLGLNVFYGGHYLTETLGVRALAAHLAAKFKLTWTFLDRPTGL